MKKLLEIIYQDIEVIRELCTRRLVKQGELRTVRVPVRRENRKTYQK